MFTRNDATGGNVFINEMRAKYAFWACSEYAETRMLWRSLSTDEKGSIVQRIPEILKRVSSIDEVENLPDMTFEGRMCLKFALRKVGLS